MTTPATVECSFHVCRQRRGRQKLSSGILGPDAAPGRVPRVAQLMALAIRFEHLLQNGQVADYASLARLGHVSRARISQIMNLLLLAPEIQEQLLFWPPVCRGRDPLHLAQLQPIAQALYWPTQRRRWQALVRLLEKRVESA